MKTLTTPAFVLLSFAIVLILPLAAIPQTAVPMLINYQGDLTSPSTGEPVADGSYNMLFRIYDIESDGAPLWEGTHTNTNGNPVQVTRGILSVILGSGAGNELSSSIFNGADRWLEIQVGAETLSPRQRITSVSYSLISENSRLLAGREAAQFANSTHAHLGDEITSGTVSEARIDPLIARDSETNAAIAAHQAITEAHHTKTRSFTELTDVAADAQIPASIARDSEVMPTVLAGDGAGSTLDADYLDGNDSSAFALSGHAHDSRYWGLTGNTGTDPATHFLGTADNQAVEFRVNNAQALRLEPGASPNIIGGYGGNRVTAGAEGATIAGGGAVLITNRVTDRYGTIGGGANNQAGDSAGTTDDAPYATVGGGYWNTASNAAATVAGGRDNDASGGFAAVGGGEQNAASGAYAAVGGGGQNAASGDGATVGGGAQNAASGDLATVGGGSKNSASGLGAMVGGGASNEANAGFATIAGGGPSDPDNPSTTRNLVTDNYGTIGGGGHNQAGDNAGTTTDARYATVGGGRDNAASEHGATVGGGVENTASGNYAAIGGGYSNEARASYATIAGGGRSDEQDPNTGNLVTDDYGTVGGGGDNQAGDNAGTTTDAPYATASGGRSNIASSDYATVGGGYSNEASANYAAVAGGYNNTASGNYATVAGGYSNEASARSAAVAGGYNNTAAGDYSFAAGRRAQAIHAGAFVWGDSQDADVPSTANNQVTFRCGGGVRFRSGSLGANQDLSWTPGNASWTFSSDRTLKENFVEIDPKEVLERVRRLPVTEWNFKGYALRHIGPVAQDFHALFPLGGSDTMIDSGDLQGVSLAAIQGLHEMLREKDEKISALQARVGALESLVGKLVQSQNGGGQ